MKFKYFLRGLGTGIIFASLVCIVAFHTSGSKEISDREVIERAKKLGMVEEKNSVKDMFVSGTEKSSKESGKKDKDSTKEIKIDVDSSETTKTEQQTTKAKKTTETTTEQKTEEQKKEQNTEASTEQTTEAKEDDNKVVEITIKGGMSSYPVCQMLQESGLIKDATDFDNYLIKNGYASRISVGTHALTIGMSYEEIAIAISDPR
ncbi:MAG: hypothetical protein IJD40_02245 [Lachnospiraceae bacterium]|nr:hypothetical protein [Lachnospiraceae bacterium]